MKHIKNDRIPLIVFSFTLAVLVSAALICGTLFAGADNENGDMSFENADSGVICVQFDKQPTEEEISAVLDEWEQKINPDLEKAEADVDITKYTKEVVVDGVTHLEFAEGTTEEQIQKAKDEYVSKGFAVNYHEGKYTLWTEEDMHALNFKYDISKHIEADDPTGIYVPVKGADFKVNVAAMINNATDGIPSIHKFAGEERHAARYGEYHKVTKFCGDRDAFLGYLSTVAYNHDGTVAYASDDYEAEDYKASYDTIEKCELYFERTAWFGNNILLGAPGSMYSSTARQVTGSGVATYAIKDYGTYLGRNAVRIAGTVTCPEYEEKTGMTTYEIIFDIETQAVMSFIAYDANGDIQSYTIITEFSMDDTIEVPLYSNINE